METQTSTSTTYSEDGAGRDLTRPDPSDNQRNNEEGSASSSSHDHLSIHHSLTEPSLTKASNNITDTDANSATSYLQSWKSTPSIPKSVNEDDIRYDVMILYSDDDKEAVEIFKEHLNNDIELALRGRIRAVLYNGPELEGLSGLNFEHLDRAFHRCSYTFVYLTKAFIENTWCKIISESCLMRSLTSKADEKMRWRVVPVYTESIDKCTFQIPMGLNALKGINYYRNDDFYRKSVAALINQTRKQIETEQQIKNKTVIYEREKFEINPQTNIASPKETLSSRDSSRSEEKTVPQRHMKNTKSAEERRDQSSQLQLQMPLRPEGDKYGGPVDDYGSPLDEDYLSNTPRLPNITLAHDDENLQKWQPYSAGQKEMITGHENNTDIAKSQHDDKDLPRSRETEFHQGLAASINIELSLQVGNTDGNIRHKGPGATADSGNPVLEASPGSLVSVGLKTQCKAIKCEALCGSSTEMPSAERNNAALYDKRVQSFQNMVYNSAQKKSPKTDKNPDTCSTRTNKNSSNSEHIKVVDNCWTYGRRRCCKICNFFCRQHIFSVKMSSGSELPCDLSEPD